MENEIAIIKTTTATLENAKMLAHTLVFEKFTACAQIGAEIQSVYNWDGETKCETEIPVEFKTSPEKAHAAVERLAAIHPYECPQIVVSQATANKSYADWCAENTR